MADGDRRHQILEAALRVFAREGFHKANIKQIANDAGIKSPALIYWYFKDKQELLRSVFLEYVHFTQFMIQSMDDSSALMELHPEEFLSLLATHILGLLDQPEVVPMLRLFISEILHGPEVADFVSDFQRAGIGSFTAYMQHQIDLKRLRPHDVHSSARAFMGTMISYLLMHEVFPALKENLPDREHYIREVVTLFLKGLKA